MLFDIGFNSFVNFSDCDKFWVPAINEIVITLENVHRVTDIDMYVDGSK